MKKGIRETKANYQHVSFLDAESLDSGMSLTNATDVRHADPELKVFYKMLRVYIDQWLSVTEADKPKQVHTDDIYILHKDLWIVGDWLLVIHSFT